MFEFLMRNRPANPSDGCWGRNPFAVDPWNWNGGLAVGNGTAGDDAIAVAGTLVDATFDVDGRNSKIRGKSCCRLSEKKKKGETVGKSKRLGL